MQASISSEVFFKELVPGRSNTHSYQSGGAVHLFRQRESDLRYVFRKHFLFSEQH